MRAAVVLASGSLAPGASTSVPFTSLPTVVGGLIANLEALEIRLTKSLASTVRPASATFRIRDMSEVLFDGNGLELARQMRERGESLSQVLGTGSSADTAVFRWRPGYGAEDGDMQHAAGLFVGGDVLITMPADGTPSQAFAYEVIAKLALSKTDIRVANRAVTRTLASGARDLAGDFILARARDASFSTANTYTMGVGSRDIITSVSGAILQPSYETSLRPAGDPVLLTAVLQTTIGPPDFVRAAGGAYAKAGLLPVSKLPLSGGVAKFSGGWSGDVIATVIYPRDRDSVKQALAVAAARAGVPVPSSSKVKTRNGNAFKAFDLGRFMPITGKLG